jgi:hypothetical protein
MDISKDKLAEERVKLEIAAEIQKRKKWTSVDFQLAHWFVWISLIASFTSAILTAVNSINPEYRWVIAVIAGLPGLILSIDKIFDFKQRAVWGVFYEIDLHEVEDDLMFGKADAYSSVKALRNVVRKNEGLYRNIGFFGSSENIKNNEDSDHGEIDIKAVAAQNNDQPTEAVEQPETDKQEEIPVSEKEELDNRDINKVKRVEPN